MVSPKWSKSKHLRTGGYTASVPAAPSPAALHGFYEEYMQGNTSGLLYCFTLDSEIWFSQVSCTQNSILLTFHHLKLENQLSACRQHKISWHPACFISLLVCSCFSALSITPANTIFYSNGSVHVCTFSMAISYIRLLNTWNMSTMTKELHFKLCFNLIYFTAT